MELKFFQVEKKHWPYQLIRLKAPVMKQGRSTEFTKASIENYSKDGLSILIRLLQMWQAMKAEWVSRVVFFVDGNLKEKIYGV
jgi:hypothetical protein